MRSLYILICAVLLTSCKGSFIKRKYMDGHFAARSAGIHSKTIDENPNNIPITKEEIETVNVRQAARDTIFLTSGLIVPCKIETITRKRVIYTYKSDPTTKFSFKNKKISSVHINSTHKEYFREPHPDGNPILQFGLVNNKKEASGMAVFGYIMLTITSIIAVAASPAMLFATFLVVILMIAYSTSNSATVGFKILDVFGKFVAWAFITMLVIGLLALILLLAAF